MKRRILKAPTVRDMLEISVSIEAPAEFKHQRQSIMRSLTIDKFRRNKELRDRLALTGNKSLCDTFEPANLSQKSLEERLFWG